MTVSHANCGKTWGGGGKPHGGCQVQRNSGGLSRSGKEQETPPPILPCNRRRDPVPVAAPHPFCAQLENYALFPLSLPLLSLFAASSLKPLDVLQFAPPPTQKKTNGTVEARLLFSNTKEPWVVSGSEKEGRPFPTFPASYLSAQNRHVHTPCQLFPHPSRKEDGGGGVLSKQLAGRNTTPSLL